jgi:hypothetical protein
MVPILKAAPEAEPASSSVAVSPAVSLEAVSLPPQAARLRTMARVRTIAKNFFFISSAPFRE